MRWGDWEVLDHSKGAVDLSRFSEGRSPILMDHDSRDQVGVAEDVTIGSDRVGRAIARFGKSTRAEEIFQDVLDGIRTLVSVGYVVNHMVLEESEVEGPSTYRVDSWKPLEISFVSVPADMSVGVGRDLKDEHVTTVEIPIADEPKDGKKAKRVEVRSMPDEIQQPTQAEIDARVQNDVKTEVERLTEINEVAGHWAGIETARGDVKALAAAAIAEKWTAAEFKGRVLTDIVPTGADLVKPPSDLDLTKREVKAFSFARAIKGAEKGKWDEHGAGFERECSNEIAKRLGKASRGFYVPYDIQHRNLTPLNISKRELLAMAKRDLLAGTDSLGGYLVGTDHLGGSFIDLLHNKTLVRQAGAMVLSGLRGNVAIPKISAGASGAWVAENTATTETNQTFASVTLAIKTVTAWTDMSRTLQLQSDPVVDRVVTNDLAGALARSIDLAALHGTGANDQPTGIAATSGIGSVAGGTNGLAPAWSHVVDLETAVAQDNADLGALAYMTNAKVRGKLKQVDKASGAAQFVWDGNGMNGYQGLVTNQVSSTLTKGSSSGICSAIFFGNWNDLMIGEWGNLDILVDPYTGGSAGTLRIIVFQDVDVAVRHAESFAAMLDALTT